MADDVYVQMAREWLERESPRQPWHTGDAHANFVAMATFAREVAARTADKDALIVATLRDTFYPTARSDLLAALDAAEEKLRRHAEEIRRG